MKRIDLEATRANQKNIGLPPQFWLKPDNEIIKHLRESIIRSENIIKSFEDDPPKNQMERNLLENSKDFLNQIIYQ